jgi:hypothetical protein
MVYDVLIAKEDARKPSAYVHSSEHRDGLDCLNYFFDLINDGAGYTHKYYDEHFERID